MMLAGAVALPIQFGLPVRLMLVMLAGGLANTSWTAGLMMLAGGLANTTWITGAADARDACRSGGLANTSWIAGAADARDANRSGGLAGWLGRLMLMVLAGGLDAHGACR